MVTGVQTCALPIYPYDEDYPRYYAKIADALSKVDTAFVAMADNDDFFVIDGVRGAAEFLQTHPDYASCGGQSAMFWVMPIDGHDANGVYGQRVDWKRTSDIRSITGDTASERIRTPTLSAGDPTYYDLKRTNVLRGQFELVRELNLRDLFLVENLLWFLNSIAGKTMRMASLYIARQQNSPESSGETHARQFGDWFGRMLAPSWSADFTSFVNATAAALAEADHLPLEQARAFMVSVYRTDVAPALLRDVLAEPSVTMMMPVTMRAVQQLVNLPRTSALRRFAQEVYRRAEWLSTDIVYGFELFAKRASRAERERQQIIECLTRRAAQ
jgi:glycosyltransferase domain-containing protein